MLKNIPAAISPALMAALMEMGHGDELVLADAHFHAASLGGRIIRADGLGIPLLLAAILRFMPLDQYVEKPAALMQVVEGDPVRPVIWDDYRRIVRSNEADFDDFEWLERFAFYDRARKAFAVLATGETAQYANIILKKGVLRS
jgi:L-fucose mutarotase